MSRIFFNCLIGALLLCTIDCYAQNGELRSIVPKQSSTVNMTTQNKTKRKFISYQRMFDELPRPQSRTQILARPEHRFIKKGDSTRVKIYFPSHVWEEIIVEGVKTTRKDIREGLFVPTIKPDKSKVVTIYFKNRSGNPNHNTYMKFVILVYDPDEYEKVYAKFKEFEDNQDAKGRDKYILDLQGDLRYQIY